MSDNKFLSEQQQEFNATIMRSVPVLLDFQMQFFISRKSDLLKEHLAKLTNVFWKSIWEEYYRIRWDLRDSFSFLETQRSSKMFNYMIIVHKFISLDALYKKMKESGFVQLSCESDLKSIGVDQTDPPAKLFSFN